MGEASCIPNRIRKLGSKDVRKLLGRPLFFDRFSRYLNELRVPRWYVAFLTANSGTGLEAQIANPHPEKEGKMSRLNRQ